jgi:(2Fe-2S) ferredoxin
MEEKRYNLCYNGRALYQNLTLEDASEVIQDFADKFYAGEDIDPSLLYLEPLFIED